MRKKVPTPMRRTASARVLASMFGAAETGGGGIHFGVAGAGGEIGLKDGKFLGFFVDEILAVAFSELIDGFFALLDEGLQDLNGFGFVESADFFGFFVLDGGLDAAEYA